MKFRFDVGVVATHVVPALGFGGVAVSAARLTAAWARVTTRHIGLCASDASETGSISAEDVRLGDNVLVKLYGAYFFRRWGFGLGAVPCVILLCIRSRALYIHGIATWPTTVAALVCWVCGRPFAIAPRGGLMPEHVDSIRRHKPAKWAYYRLLTLPSLRRARTIHCTSEEEAATVRDYVGTNAPVEIVPNGIDLGEVADANSQSPAEALTLCYVGRISHEKGVNGFIRAWLEVRRPADRLIIAGGSGGRAHSPYFDEFLDIVESSGGAVDFRGYVGHKEVIKIVSGAHFLVLPSGLDGEVHENFGNVVAEALAVGRPVLCCRGLVWDELEAAGAGFIFDRNLSAAKQVIRCASLLSIETWLEMARNARGVAEQSLDINVLAERIWKATAEAGPFQ